MSKYIYITVGELQNVKHEDESLTVAFSTHEAHNAWLTCKRSRLGLKFDEKYKVSSSDAWAIRFEVLQLPEC